MPKWQQQIRTWIGRYFDLPADVMLDLPRITTIGSIHVYIENHTGLLHFSEEEVRIQYKKGQVRIVGRDLGVKMMLKEELLLEGELKSVEFFPDSKGG
ncbi:sporulation protein YqfC [Halobacillus kuroshimensis]|uniref:Sporulation protein YqfC n=2 Tax=Halobacillus TaxID=45667 RepID=A0A845DQY8_9BACI|nr:MULTISPECIES: sporulation protein YqfC [Halobacillus]MBN8236674.1 sporulation protein YqfC [Halobacillus kuroshimensis]MCA1021425.1 sporulation protein YqfC [Halobacillus litoralis]MYL19816.1 sporulation protein YqfC [Halobacillus litoralis]MYL28962.1 sporulation protein YqfC [Halobacillus halophilus]MYL37213.1 sporulation protein YqfC [Halobacillus litoralis]